MSGSNNVAAKKKGGMGRKLFSACLCFRRKPEPGDEQATPVREVPQNGNRESAPSRVITPSGGQKHTVTKPAVADSGIEAVSIKAGVENQKANDAVKDGPNTTEKEQPVVLPIKEEPVKTTEKVTEKPAPEPATQTPTIVASAPTADVTTAGPPNETELPKVEKVNTQGTTDTTTPAAPAPLTGPSPTVADDSGEPPIKPEDKDVLPPAPEAPPQDESEPEKETPTKSEETVVLSGDDNKPRQSDHQIVEKQIDHPDEEEQQRWLLPPLRPEFEGKKCLVLDLDETLVHSSFKVSF